MRLILLHTDGSLIHPMENSLSSALANVLGIPIAQHQIELGYANWVKEVHLIANEQHDTIKSYFGDGTRFGVSLSIHFGALSGDETKSLLKHRFLFSKTLFILSGMTLINVDLKDAFDFHNQKPQPITLFRNEASGEVLGCIVKPGGYNQLKSHTGRLKDVLNKIQATKPAAVNEWCLPHFCNSGEGVRGLLSLNEKALLNQNTVVHNPYFEKEKGVFVGYGTNIHPKATITPPVVLGNHCQIMARAKIGPLSAIGNRCIIAKRARVRQSVVLPNTYIGELTEFRRAVVMGDRLFRADSEEKTIVVDSFLLSSIGDRFLAEMLDKTLHRAMAIGLIAALGPFALGIIFSDSQKKRAFFPMRKIEALKNGVAESFEDIGMLGRFSMNLPENSSSFLGWFFRLFHVLKGEMRLFGPSPITPEDAQRLEEAWMLGRFHASPGAFDFSPFFEDENERLVAEAIYAKTRTLRLDLRIGLAYLMKPFVGTMKARKFIGI